MEPDNDYKELLVDFDELLAMNNSQFNDKYGYMSGSWRGKNIWKRNNTKEQLEEFLNHN